MIEQLEQWLAQHQSSFNDLNVSYVKNQGNSALVDIETVNNLARITLWEDGNCDMEVIDLASEKQLSWNNYQFATWSEAQSKVSAFLTNLK